MRRRYIHSNPIKPFRIRNRFSHDSRDETTLPDVNMEETNNYDDVNYDYNEFDYDNEMILSEDDVITESSDDDNEEKGNDEEEGSSYEEEGNNYEEEGGNNEEEEGYNEDNNEEEEEEEGNNEEEEHNHDDEEGNNNKKEEIHQIVEALDEDKIPSCDGEFAPYFNNYTTTALFCWLQKHNVSTKAYEDLVDIIHNPQFEPTHVVKNIRRFQSWRKRLPLLPIITKPIKISPKKTPSTSRGSKLSYQLSISEIIWRVLNNPMLTKHMYFGPGIDSEKKSEFWHGNLWGESPLFGQHEILILEGNKIIYFDIIMIY